MHSTSPLVMAFCLVCLGILAKNMPKRLAGYYLPNSYNTSTKEYDEPPGMSSRKSISSHFIHNKADKSASNSLNSSIFEGLVTLCAPDAVCFSRHVPHASGRILAERFYVIGTLRSNFLLHKKDPPAITGIEIFFFSSLLTGFISLPEFLLHC